MDLLLEGALGHYLHDRCIVTVYQDSLALELIPQIARTMVMAYSSLQVMLIGPIPEAGLWELTLTPVSLEVAAKPMSLASVKS